ncbi:ATP-binding protein [Bacteroides stercorirosoris]|uniref:ATP-binding protein n=1 Tax=Bacteroides stercorirosoris TaxID=871324 RepID=UPI0030B7FD39
MIEAHLEMYGKRPILFLDEIQNIEGWEKFARRLADEKYKVYITGSNAKMLSSDIQTTLGGRYITINVYPYSFREFLEVHHTVYDELSLLSTESRAAVMNRFIDYFHNGGFPEGALLAAKRNYLTSVYQKIYLGDIAARNGISNTFGLKIMIKKLAESVKQPVSFNRIANIVSTTGSKLSTTSAIKYVEYAESAWLLQRINNIAAKLAEKESNSKYYFTDNGILNLFLIDGNTSLLENLVAISLIRQFGREDSVFFYNKGVEVDFYIPEEQWAIQVSYSIKDPETKERETDALIKLFKVLPCKRLLIITFDEEGILQTNSDIEIEVIPIWKWLLKETQ